MEQKFERVIPKAPEIKEVQNGYLIIFSSLDEAKGFVREFWQAMPHREHFFPDDQAPDWSQELTAGDRTSIIQGKLPAVRGRWLVQLTGYHQALSQEAASWIRQRMNLE